VTHPFSRSHRVGEQIQRAIAEILNKKSSDPRFQGLGITDVDVSPDFANALVFVTVRGHQDPQASLKALNKASGYFRHQLAGILDLRVTPKLKFVFDETAQQGERVTQLLSTLPKKPEGDDFEGS
jgi:ribosome-binding factor A